MITFKIGWGKRREIKTGEYPETFTDEGKARAVKSEKDQQHPRRLHWLVARTGGSDGR